MSLDVLKSTAREIVDHLAREDYDSAVRLCVKSRLTSDDLRTVIRDYGQKLVSPPDGWPTQAVFWLEWGNSRALPMISNVEIVVTLLPEVLRLANQAPRHPLFQRLERLSQGPPR
jgi:hypothetical protein